MTDSKLRELLSANIYTALEDYWRHTNEGNDIYKSVSDRFINRLAGDAVTAKKELREMLRRSPAWDENLQAVVINGKRTHNPDYIKVRSLGWEILRPYVIHCDEAEMTVIHNILSYFANPSMNNESKQAVIEEIEKLAPNAYHKGRKKSRIFKAICDELGITDDTKGSNFQKLFAQFADELSSKKIDYKLFLSINPAHFLTMSNPKGDYRGMMLTSCHSLNSDEYPYNCGCSGYARDDVTMIAFTVADPTNPELLNNRKTSRQLFMYKPDNGLLLQSRLYNTDGGTTGAQKDSVLYRDLVQREISDCESVPNLWKTFTYRKWAYENLEGRPIKKGHGFGGYEDWIYEEFDTKVSIRSDHNDDFEIFKVGTYGLCLSCAGENSEGIHCDNCKQERICCRHCGDEFVEDELTVAYDGFGNERYVCEDCLDEHYRLCDHCRRWVEVDCCENQLCSGGYICDDCAESYYTMCMECGKWDNEEDNMTWAFNGNGEEGRVCGSCYGELYYNCCECQDNFHEDNIVTVTNSYGELDYACTECAEKYYTKCEHCGEYHHNDHIHDGVCDDCAEEKAEEA